LADLQSVLYAHNRYSVLLIFQGMDTAGKGGAIKHVMSGVNPQGCQVFSFQQPSREELDHDFFWRTNKRLPERGRIGIFDRSYYEEVLIVRVDPKVFQAQRLPKECVSDKIWEERHQDIVHLENYLHRNGTRIVKFFLHLSKEEQRQRFLARIDDPDKNWKLTQSDIEVRKQWDTYQKVYADCLGATTSEAAPWHIVPADDKRNARLIVSQIVVETLKNLKMEYPTSSETHKMELEQIRKALESED
jgi:PPK2 family polyphosphate:nucleotide phosphotransferase